MSNKNDENVMTYTQIERQLKNLDTDQSEIKKSFLELVKQFQCLDRIAKSIGLTKDGFSFLNRVAWKTILSKLEYSETNENKSDEVKVQSVLDIFSQSSNQLENELIPQLQKLRNSWMIKVLLIEFMILGLVGLSVAGTIYINGLWSVSNFTISFQSFLYERPVFSLIVLSFLFFSFVLLHFKIRGFVAKQSAKKLNEQSSEFDLANAFLKNTRLQHSIFRPDIIGWGWLNRKCLLKKMSYRTD